MMTEENKMMASFRVDREDWGRFGALAKGERLTVTQLLTDYIDWCLAAGKSMYGVRIVPDGNTYQVSTAPTPEGIQAAIDKALAPIQIDIADLLGRVDRLETVNPVAPQLQTTKPIETQNGVSIPSEEPMLAATEPKPREEPKPTAVKPEGEALPGKRAKADDPEFRAAVVAGQALGLTGQPLCEFLWDDGKGFGSIPRGAKKLEQMKSDRLCHLIKEIELAEAVRRADK
jgi:hypothetical protein